MKRSLLIVIYIGLAIQINFGQNGKSPVKNPSTKTTKSTTKSNQTPAKTSSTSISVSKISETEWNEIVKSIDLEDWNKAFSLIPLLMKKLKTDNPDRQLARLRYLYLYSLAGKVMQEKATFPELEKLAESFVGQDFLMPSREITADCAKKLNYICPVLENDKALRITTINKSATSIISFEYVKLPQSFNAEIYNGKQAFLGGKLKKVELNPNDSTVWIMRLFFEDGIILIVK